jgi:hypothetical protein
MTIDHPGNKANSFHYTICWDLDQNGNPVWCQAGFQVGGLGWSNQGGGIAFAQLDKDPRPEIVLMGIDHPGGQNTSFWYIIGWNVSANGVTTSWSPVIHVDGVGWDAYAGGLTFAQLDGNSRPEMILMAVDKQLDVLGDWFAGSYRYKIGWHVGPDGKAEWWSSGTMASIDAPCFGGPEVQGAGVAFAQLNGSDHPDPEMILMTLQHWKGHPNWFDYRVRFDVNAGTVMNNWDSCQ